MHETARRAPEDAFPADLIACALGGATEPWQHDFARGVLVDPVDGLAKLNGYDDPALPYYRSVLSWMAGDVDTACRGLERQDSSTARGLFALIKEPRIKVLTQIPPAGAGSFRLLDGIAADQAFEIHNIARGDDDIVLRPYERVLDRIWKSSAVAFYVCATIESQHPPFDLVHLPWPTIGVTSDYDARFLSVSPWLKAFDQVMVCDQEAAWRDVRALKGRGVHAFPLVFCTPPETPPLAATERDIDVLFSGTLFSPSEPDKAEIVHELLRIPGLRLVLLDGHVSHEAYHALLSRARATQNFGRRPGAMLAGALESLSLGSLALVPKGSVHEIWGGPGSGVIAFQPGRIAETVAEVLRNYDSRGAACDAHAARIRTLFSATAVAAKFFRYATVLAAHGRCPRDVTAPSSLIQRRHVFLDGPRPTLAEATRDCQDHLAAVHPALGSTERLNVRARERVLLHCQAMHERQPVATGALGLDAALDDLRLAAAEDPDALVVRFNLARVLRHLGAGAAHLREAHSLAATTIARRPGEWRLDVADDVYPWDFFGTWFNSRSYLDTVIGVVAGRAPAGRLVELIYASLHHYLSVWQQSLEHAREAHRLDAAFSYYRLQLARLLADSERPEQLREAIGLLTHLADHSEIAGLAYGELRALFDRVPDLAWQEEPGSTTFQRADASTLLLNQDLASLRSDYEPRARLIGTAAFAPVVRRNANADGPVPRLSILVCGLAGRGCIPLLTALDRQRADRATYELIYVDCFEAPPRASPFVDILMSCGQTGFLEHRLQALAQALAQARGAVIVVLEPHSVVGDTFVGDLLAAYYVTDDDETTAAQQVLVTGWPEAGWPLRYVAFPIGAALVAGGFDVHQVFGGGRGTPLELAWRLQQLGLPVVIDANGCRAFTRLAPWWQLPPFSENETLLSVCRILWPRLVDPERVDALVPWRQVRAAEPPDGLVHVEATSFGFSIRRYQGRYVAVRQTLGDVDFHVGPATLLRQLGQDHVVIGEDLSQVSRGAAAFAIEESPAPPVVRLENVQEFTVFRVRDRVIGIHQALGRVNLGNVHGWDHLVAAYGADNVILGATLDQVRARILGQPDRTKSS